MSIDYAFMNDCQDKKKEEEKGMPIRIIKDHETKMRFARVVPKKGADAYAITRRNKDLEQLGYKIKILKAVEKTA